MSCHPAATADPTDLVEDYGHEEKVEQEGLGGSAAVKLEEDNGEGKRDELVAGIAEGRAKELHPSNCHQEDITAGARHRHLSGLHWSRTAAAQGGGVRGHGRSHRCTSIS